MEKELIIQGETKQERYKMLLPQIEAVVKDETDLIANMANVAAMLHETFNFWWTGFYRVVGEDRRVAGKDRVVREDPIAGEDRVTGEGCVAGEELVLGPFQGPMACTRIRKGRGVCGTAWAEERTQVVPDVEKFPGHIACSSASRSEIVVPVWKEGKIIAVLDIDSAQLDTFDETDRDYLEKIALLL